MSERWKYGKLGPANKGRVLTAEERSAVHIRAPRPVYQGWLKAHRYPLWADLT